MARRRRTTIRGLHADLRSPQSRYILAALTLLAVTSGQTIAALIVGAATAYAWKA